MVTNPNNPKILKEEIKSTLRGKLLEFTEDKYLRLTIKEFTEARFILILNFGITSLSLDNLQKVIDSVRYIGEHYKYKVKYKTRLEFEFYKPK